MKSRTWAIVVAVAVVGSVLIAIANAVFDGPLSVNRIFREEKRTVFCNENAACRTFVQNQIRSAIKNALKGVVPSGAGNNPGGLGGGSGGSSDPTPPPPLAQLCVDQPDLQVCLVVPMPGLGLP